MPRHREDPQPNPDVDRSGDCTLDAGQPVTIDVLATQQQFHTYVTYVELGEEVGCNFLGGDDIVFAAGRWWGISVSADGGPGAEPRLDEAATALVAEAAGGDVQRIDC